MLEANDVWISNNMKTCPLHLWVQQFVSFKNLLGQRCNLSSPVKSRRRTNHSSAIFFTGPKTPSDYFSFTFLDPDSRVFCHHRSSSFTATAPVKHIYSSDSRVFFLHNSGLGLKFQGKQQNTDRLPPPVLQWSTSYLLFKFQVLSSQIILGSHQVAFSFWFSDLFSLLYAYLELYFRSSFQIGSLYCLQIYLSRIIVNCVILHISISCSLCSWFNSALWLFVSWSIVPYIS